MKKITERKIVRFMMADNSGMAILSDLYKQQSRMEKMQYASVNPTYVATSI